MKNLFREAWAAVHDLAGLPATANEIREPGYTARCEKNTRLYIRQKIYEALAEEGVIEIKED